MPILRLLVAASLVVLISACVPTIQKYYKANAKVGEAIAAPGCRPDKSWLVEFGDVSVEVYLWTPALGISVRVPEQATVEMESNEIAMWADDMATSQRASFETFTAAGPGLHDRRSVVWNSQLVGTSKRWLGMKIPMVYDVTVTFEKDFSEWEQFHVAVPPLRINGQRHELSVVTFSRSRRFFIQPINC